MTEDFPVTWDDPADAAVMWRQDKWHFPDPATPLTGDAFGLSGRGFSRAMATQGAPVRMEPRRINSYLYNGIRQPRPGDPEPNPNQKVPDRFDNHAAWDNEWLPEIRSFLSAWEAFHRTSPTAEELVLHLDQAFEWNVRCWEIHALLNFGIGGLVEFCEREIGWTMPQVDRLVAGITNKSLESDDRLRELTAMVRKSPALTAAFTENELASILDRLPDGAEATAFQSSLDAFLQEFGKRSDNIHELAIPSWIEDPTPVLAVLRAYVVHPERDHAAMRAGLVAQREAATAEARALAAAKSAEVAEQFERELTLALRGADLNETHNYWIDQQAFYWLRRDFLVAGEMLVAQGVLQARDDVFFLRIAEVLAALRGDATQKQAVVAERKAEMERFRKVSPPMELGAPAPPFIKNNMSRVFGNLESAAAPGEVRGQPGSPGVVTGRARIIESLLDADKLEPGDILVASTTSPPWTPLFGIAAAVVTDAGGAMSHAGIVAREYAIPAVLGCFDATAKIKDGAMITVDGDAGVVRL